MSGVQAPVRPADHALQVAKQHAEADKLVRRVQAGEVDAEAFALELARSYGSRLRAISRAVCRALQRAA